jgi:hypothetical protein
MKKAIKYIVLFCVTLIVLIIFLCVAALIPQNYIKTNSQKSAMYLTENESVFYSLVDGEKLTTIDNYADTILLNIVYNLNSEQPLKSVLSASFYNKKEINANEAYKIVVTENKTPNETYTRYWHGQMIFIKPLLLFFDIRGIRWFNAVIMMCLSVLLGMLLIKNELKTLCVAFFSGMILTAVFIVPLCLEYTSTFMIMLITCIIALLVVKKGDETIMPLFFVSGMMTCFFDFLTTETLTLTMPLVMVLCARQKRGELKDSKSGFVFSMKAVLLWIGAYALMWLAKWGISTLVLGTNTFSVALENAQFRTTGNVVSGSLPIQALKAVFRNVTLLIPFNFAKTYGNLVFLFLAICFLVFCLLFLYGKKLRQPWFLKLLILVAAVPYIRYVVISSHSYLHYFFTYRAQLVTVCVLVYILITSLLQKPYDKEFRRKIKNNH